jgi:hypothetical protein
LSYLGLKVNNLEVIKIAATIEYLIREILSVAGDEQRDFYTEQESIDDDEDVLQTKYIISGIKNDKELRDIFDNLVINNDVPDFSVSIPKILLQTHPGMIINDFELLNSLIYNFLIKLVNVYNINLENSLNKLLIDELYKYTIKEINKIKNEETPNILSVINVDNNIDILLQLKYNDIKNVCLVNKNYKNICEMKEFWKRLIEKDFPYILFYEKINNNLILNKELYEKLLNEHNNNVLIIIRDFIIVTEFYDNLQELYNNINKELIIYLENVNKLDNKDDKNAIIKLDNIFIDQIFNLLHVKINNNAKTFDKVELKYKSENNKWLHMAEILWFFRKNIDLLI